MKNNRILYFRSDYRVLLLLLYTLEPGTCTRWSSYSAGCLLSVCVIAWHRWEQRVVLASASSACCRYNAGISGLRYEV